MGEGCCHNEWSFLLKSIVWKGHGIANRDLRKEGSVYDLGAQSWANSSLLRDKWRDCPQARRRQWPALCKEKTQVFSPDNWSPAARTSRKRSLFRACSLFVFWYRFWRAQNVYTTTQETFRQKQEQISTMGNEWLDSSGMGVLVQHGLRRKLYFWFQLFFFFSGTISKMFYSELQPK